MVEQNFCPCGSGLRRIRCCALDLSTLSGPEATAALLPMLEQADARLKAGDMAGAEGLVKQLLEVAPGREEALVFFYRLLRQQNRLQPAEAIIRRVVTLNPNNFWATNELTLMLLNRGALAEAEVHARNAIRIAPQNAQAHNLMGLVLTEANRPLIGEYHYRRVLELADAQEPITLANLAWNLKNQGRMEEARKLYQTSMKLKPGVIQTVLGFAKMEEADRKFSAALKLLDEADAIFPDNPSVKLTRATVLARQKETEAALEILHEPEEAADGTPTMKLGPNELSEKGRLLDQLGRYDEAFAAFDTAKKRAVEFGARTYLAEGAADLAARLKGFFVERRLKTLPVAQTRTDMPQPVFIVGFPRSGTTLIEQTITVHPRISAGDELPYINDITQIMPRLLASPLGYPEALAELWMGDQRDGLNELRDYYLNRSAKSGIFRAGADFLAGPGIADHPCHPPSAGCAALGLFQPSHARVFLRGADGNDRPALRADRRSHRALQSPRQNALFANSLRGYGGRPGNQCAQNPRLYRGRFRPEMSQLRGEHPLRSHRLLRPGDRKTLRPFALPLPPVFEAFGAGAGAADAGDRAAGL
jgi:tetratricopeptide (TPR) repeat protein